MKRKMIFALGADGNLHIEIQCEHGSMRASTLQGDENPTTIRYMVNELIKDERISQAFDIEFVDDNGLA